jgi:hypothetical protein
MRSRCLGGHLDRTYPTANSEDCALEAVDPGEDGRAAEEVREEVHRAKVRNRRIRAGHKVVVMHVRVGRGRAVIARVGD